MRESQIPIEVRAAIGQLQEQIENPRQFAIPEINFGRFGNEAEDVREFSGYIADWLKFPYRSDKFGGDHVARREWLEAMRKKFGNAFEPAVRKVHQNKWRGGSATGIVVSAREIVDTLNGKPEYTTLVADLAPLSAAQYAVVNELKTAKGQELAKRKEVLEQLEDQMLQFLQMLSHWSKESLH